MRVSGAVLALMVWFTAAFCVAQDGQPTAQQHFERGVELTKAEQWAEAQASFEASIGLAPRAATYLNLAIVRYRLGEYVAALSALETFERDAGIQEDVKKRAQWLRDKLAQHVVRFHLQVEPTDAVVEIDGAAQPGTGAERKLWLTAGQHEVRASAQGYEDDRMRIVATAGAETQAAIALKVAVTRIPVTLGNDGPQVATGTARPREDEPNASRPLWKNPWLWTAVGVVVVGGAITAGVLLARDDRKEPACNPDEMLCL